MPTITVSIKNSTSATYPIFVKNGFMEELSSLLKTDLPAEKYAIITDKKVEKLFAKNIVQNIKRGGEDAKIFSFIGGDKNKTLATAEKIITHMLAKKFTRKDAIITLGGGVPGDLGGFVASVYMRGIPYIHIPTTLLAMVDSSIGGKTGVNTPAGKNLIGSFHQPRAVFIDPKFLTTLPPKQIRNGLSEIVKYALIHNEKIFTELEKAAHQNQNTTIPPHQLNNFIEQCCRIKASIIQQDEKEHNLRLNLNYGHTIGHALETTSNYRINHGQAIAAGIILVNTMATNKKLLSSTINERIKKLINTLDLAPKNLTIQGKSNLAQHLWTIIQNDKKVTKNKPTFIFITKIGQAKTTQMFSQKDLEKALYQY